MIIKCKICKTEIEVNENEYSPGDVVTVECRRCGDLIDVTIPERIETSAPSTSVINVVKAEPQSLQEPETTQEIFNPAEDDGSLPSDNVVEETEVFPSAQSIKSVPKKKAAKSSKKATDSDKDLAESTSDVAPKKKTNSKKSTNQEETTSTQAVSTPPKTKSIKAGTKKKVSAQPVRTTPKRTEKEKGSTTFSCGGLLMVAVIIIAAGYGVYKFWPLHSGSDQTEAVEEVAVEVEDYTNPDGTNIEEGYIPEEMSEDLDYVAPDSVTAPVDSIAAEEAIESPAYLMGFHTGTNHLNGEMINTDDARYPFTLDFYYDPDDDTLSNIIYVNTTSGTRLKLNVEFFSSTKIRLVGRDGGKDFILQFSNTKPYSGDAWWGSFHQEIELTYK